MHPEITAMAAAEHVRDLRAEAARRASHPEPGGTSDGLTNRRTSRRQRAPLRSQTGWALVALGLRIVASGSR